MKRKSMLIFGAGFLLGVLGTVGVQPAIGRFVQQEGGPGFGPPGFGPQGFGPPGMGPGGPGGFGPPGMGPGGPGAKDVQLVDKFDANEDGWLNAEERTAAKEELKSQPNQGRGPGGFGRGRRGPGGPGGPGGAATTAKPGRSMTPADVQQYSDESLYDDSVLRTIFIQFEDVEDWNAELATFKPTDVEVPATVTVDGKTYPKVGIKYRGNSSYGMVPEGFKKSLNLSFDMADKDQDLLGYRTLNLLNCAGDGSLLSSAIYSHIAGPYMAIPKSNMVRVVINGECWGLYANVQQFNKDFLKEMYGQSKGARWKVPGRPGGDGGLRYVGENIDDYRSRFEIKSKDRDEDWEALIEVCRVIDETAPADLPAKLEPLMDIDQLLWFLAVDNVSVNSDGYWTRASDYSIYRDPNGVFHLSPYDMNEAFMTAQHGPPGGPGGFGPPGGPGQGGPRQGGQEQRGPGQGPGGFGFPGFGPPGPPPEGAPPEGFQPPPGGPEGQGVSFTGGMQQDRPQQRAGQQRSGQQRAGQQRGQRQDEGQRGQRDRGGRRGGRGFGGPGGHGSVDLDPLVGLDDDNKPLRSKILAVPQWRQQYLANVKTLAEKEMAWDKIGPFLQAYHDLLAEDVRLDTRRQSPAEAFEKATNSDEEGSLKSFFTKRREYLLKLPAIKDLSIEGKPAASKVASGAETESVEAAAPRLASSDSMGLVINEFLAQPAKDDQAGSDWIELYNDSNAALDLSDFALSDSFDQPGKWSFPAGTMIPAKGFVVVLADEQQSDSSSGLHAGFKLSKKGETILLTRQSDDQLQVVDQIEFPAQSAGVSFGRYPNFSGAWQPLAPTPGKPNRDAE